MSRSEVFLLLSLAFGVLAVFAAGSIFWLLMTCWFLCGFVGIVGSLRGERA